ncbi:metallophosphoesterase [Verrucomicrobiaceae bacterium N1E253]|uniref:Metallophosphoesterase n=1 Tax=Oceaniferula marina TaxID=2748318 RepID=A0A851GJD5_9BACT|nr:metallophosphoesterase [Oceaniferula marina]NWK57112.1 metallophosphoesterase [Oceaniferula marina]
MPTRRQFLQTSIGASAALTLPSVAGLPGTEKEATFILVADTHYSSVDENHPASLAMVKAINRIADGSFRWPIQINGQRSGFSCAGTIIQSPRGIIHLGDITDFGGGTELNGGKGFLGLKHYLGFRPFWEHDGEGVGKSKLKVAYPVHCGLGNHDLDHSQRNRERMWAYIRQRHAGENPPIPVSSFDDDSLSYALHWGPLRILQLHRFATDRIYGRKPALPWLKRQLAQAKQSGQHVLLCQHYGFDPFGIQSRWWTEKDRTQLLDALAPYTNIIGLCHGHSHATGHYFRKKLRVIRCNNMGWELDRGNKDGYGSFALVRATDTHFDLVHVQCINASGDFRFSPKHAVAIRTNRTADNNS